MVEVKAERVIAAIPSRTARALTSPEQLMRWCCEQAIVTADTYRLSGRTILGGELGGRLLSARETGLQFEWPLAGAVSIVTITLAAEPQSGNPPADFTRVTVHHAGIPEGALADLKFPQETWECVWVLWLRNLRLWLERAESSQFDFAASAPKAVERSLVMDGAPEQIWQALTNPDLRRRWLAGLQFGEVLEREEGRYLLFDWPQYGPSQVGWRLEPLSDGRTLVTVREEKAQVGLEPLLGWHDYLVALYQETARPLIRQTEWIKASPAKVWRFLATQEGMRRWWNPGILFEPRVGGRVSFDAHGSTLSGKVRAYEADRKLAFSWTEEGMGWPDTEPLLLTLELTEERGGTRIHLTHSGFENLPEAVRPKELASYQRGWSYGSTLPRLKQMIEQEESPMVRAFDNVSLPVSNMERSLAFYRDVLGMTIQDSYGDHMKFMAIPGATTTVMLRYRESVAVGGGYICLVTDDVRARRGELAERGVKITDGPYHIPGVGHGMDIQDPDGHMIVLIDLTDRQ